MFRFLADDSSHPYFKLNGGTGKDTTGKSVGATALIIPQDSPISEPFLQLIEVEIQK